MTVYIEELENYVHDQSEIYAKKKKKKRQTWEDFTLSSLTGL